MIQMKMLGLPLKLEDQLGLVILTCHLMEEVKEPRDMAGLQDARRHTPIGILVNQTMGGGQRR